MSQGFVAQKAREQVAFSEVSGKNRGVIRCVIRYAKQTNIPYTIDKLATLLSYETCEKCINSHKTISQPFQEILCDISDQKEKRKKK